MKTVSWLLGSLLAIGGLLANGCSSSNGSPGTGGSSGGKGTGGMGTGGKGTGGAGTGGAGTGGITGADGGGDADGATPPTCTQIPSLASGSTTFTVTSTEFANCTPIPAASTCDAKPFPQGTSPALTWTAGPTGTKSYALVLKDLSVLARTASTDPLYNRGYHYVMWNIPASATGLPAATMGGFMSPTVSGALQWSNFNNYSYFGPCPNFDPTMPTSFNDSYSFEIYALPVAKVTIPAATAGISTVRTMDDLFKSMALAVAEHRGTSDAHSSGIPAGVLPPTALPPCASGSTSTDGSAGTDGSADASTDGSADSSTDGATDGAAATCLPSQ